MEKEFDVFKAASARKGLSLLCKQYISMLLLDLNIPDMNGIKVLRAIREKYLDMKIIVMTDVSCYEWARECADLNIQGYVEKPFDLLKLTERINKLIGSGTTKFLKSFWKEEYETKVSSLSSISKNALIYFTGREYYGCRRSSGSKKCCRGYYEYGTR